MTVFLAWVNLSSTPPVVLKVPSCISSGSIRLHASNPNLSSAALGNDKVDPEALDSPFDVAKLQEDFCRVATTCEQNIIIRLLLSMSNTFKI